MWACRAGKNGAAVQCADSPPDVGEVESGRNQPASGPRPEAGLLLLLLLLLMMGMVMMVAVVMRAERV